MALSARLAASPPAPVDVTPFSPVKWGEVPAHLLWKGDRRMEAENYLSSGYGLRLAIEERAVGWKRLGQMARVWQPSRLKGIQLGPDEGTPFLAATQVFDIRPVARKWLSLEKTDNASERFVTGGNILVTCSGSVGRSTLAYGPHEESLVSHDLLRVEAADSRMWGWLYAYLRSPQARAMMTGAQYGHIIKHLETSHLDALPVPVVTDSLARRFHKQTEVILALRNRAYQLTLEADSMFEKAVGKVKASQSETGFEVSVADIKAGRRRLEASFYAPLPAALLKHYRKFDHGTDRLADVATKVWWMSRFRRFYGDGGIRYLSADELFTVNPDETKRILVDPKDGHESYFVKSGWILMACSGQVYGLNGAACLATEHHENVFFSHDLIRIIPDKTKIRSGYLLTTLTHPRLGRPLLIRSAYGTSIPHLDPHDVSDFPVVRLDKRVENAIADLAEESAALRARADVVEREMAEEAGKLIDRFLAGDVVDFVVTMPATLPAPSAPAAGSIPEHSVVRLRHDLPNDGLKAGDTGTVVHVYQDSAGYEVEFVTGHKRPKLVTLEPADIELPDAD